MSNYGIIQARSLENLAKKVNEMIEKGYKPVGGILVEDISGYIDKYYVQAMVKID